MDHRLTVDFDVLSLAVVGACRACVFAKNSFESSLAEGGLACLLLVFWSCALPFIMNPDSNAAVAAGIGIVLNSNLYFFSWISFICIVFVVGDFAQEKAKASNVFSKAPPKTAKWFGLAASSMVVMASASELYRAAQCSQELTWTTFCARTAFAISVGVISFLFMVFGILSSRSMLAAMAELTGAVFVLVFYIFGTALITFGPDGAGQLVGNLYFSTWISFVLSLLLTIQCFRDYYNNGRTESTDEATTAVDSGDDAEKVTDTGRENDNKV